MSEQILLELGILLFLGIGSQWVAWRFKLPSIILLLLVGFLAGPIFHVVHPDQIFGDLLLPLVSISVAIILFEGGLSLRWEEFRSIGGSLISLATIGAFITFFLSSFAAYYILQINFKISVLIGAILVVTGPTVITPLLRFIKPSRKVAEILKWEGIIIDPIGALLAVLVFEVIELGSLQHATGLILLALGKTIVASILISFFFSWILYYFLKKYWIPDYLEESVTLTAVILAFVISNHIQAESGLFTATFMGIFLTNQKKVSIRAIVEFKENLVVLIISLLFIILAARIRLEDFQNVRIEFFLFLLVLLVVIRPIAVLLSTIFGPFTLKEKIFISWMAPRGIVAAAVSSIFAFKLSQAGVEDTQYIIPVIFGVIMGTVTIYGFTSPFLARFLKLAQANPQGILIAGAHSFSIELAKFLQSISIPVILVDTNIHHVLKARIEGLRAYRGNILSEKILEEIDLIETSKLMAMTSNDEANSLKKSNREKAMKKSPGIFRGDFFFQKTPHMII